MQKDMDYYLAATTSKNRKVDSSSIACTNGPSTTPETIVPTVQLRETRSSYSLTVHLPGFKREDVKVEMDNSRVLVVRGQKQVEGVGLVGYTWKLMQPSQTSNSQQNLMRKPFKVPQNVNVPSISATFQQGYLLVVMPKGRPSARYSPYDVNGSRLRRNSRTITKDNDLNEEKPSRNICNDSEMQEAEQKGHDTHHGDSIENTKSSVESPESDMVDAADNQAPPSAIKQSEQRMNEIEQRGEAEMTEAKQNDDHVVTDNGMIDSLGKGVNEEPKQEMKNSSGCLEIKQEEMGDAVKVPEAGSVYPGPHMSNSEEELMNTIGRKGENGVTQSDCKGEQMVNGEGGKGAQVASDNTFHCGINSVAQGIATGIATESRRLMECSTAKLLVTGLALSSIVCGVARRLIRR